MVSKGQAAVKMGSWLKVEVTRVTHVKEEGRAVELLLVKICQRNNPAPVLSERMVKVSRL